MSKTGKLLGNTAYTIGGMMVMNAILQLVIYPLLQRHLGGEEMGEVLYIMGLTAILCPSVGQALNTSRLVVRRSHPVANGDYTILLLLYGGIGSLLCLWFGRRSLERGWEFALAGLLFMATIFRYYGDVEYRLTLSYRRYFVYYLLVGLGCLAGYGLFLKTENWFIIFLCGEAGALIYVTVKGQIFKEFWKRSDAFYLAASRGGLLCLSYMITNGTLQMDRLVLRYFEGSGAVTDYYVVSLLGKTLVLLVAPMNTIVISYLTKRERTLDRKEFTRMGAAGLAVAAIFFLACQLAAPVFIRLFYGNLYDQVKDLILIVNGTQILALLSAYLFILALTLTGESWQLILQGIHLVLMSGLTIWLTIEEGIYGFALGAFAANLLRVLMVAGLAYGKTGGRYRDANR